MKPSKRILVVDDHVDHLVLMQFVLESLGSEVEVASSVREGIEKIQTQAPDLVLVDFMMPDSLGSELIAYIRQNKATTRIPIVVVTAYVPREGQVVDFGDADLILYKPVDIDEIQDRVQQVLSKSELVLPSGKGLCGDTIQSPKLQIA